MRRFFVPIALLGLCIVSAPARAELSSKPSSAVAKDSADLGDPEGFRSQQISMQMAVTSPQSAVAKAERAVRKMGGIVQSSNASASNGSLNAQIPPGQLNALTRVVRRLPGTVTSTNTHTNDYRQYATTAIERMRVLNLAEKQLARTLAQTTDQDSIRGLLLLGELITRDRDSSRSSLRSYRDQTTLATFSVNFTKLK